MTIKIPEAAAFFLLLLGTQSSVLSPAVQALPPKLPPPIPLHFQPPKGERFTLKNGITVFLLENHELPIVRGEALIRAGDFYADPRRPGAAELAGAAMRSGGSDRFDADVMNETLEFLGASVESGMEEEQGSSSFDCLSRDLDTVLPIFADDLMHPIFRADKVEVEKQQFLEGLLRRNDEPREIARREARRALFGASHPYGRRLEASDVKDLSRTDLLDFHGRFYRPRATTLALSGDFRTKDMLARLDAAFGGWKDRPPEPLPAIPPIEAAGRRVLLIAKDDVTQTAVRIVQPGLKRHDPDHFSFEIANGVLGGDSFVSRLFREIRSRRGLAYGVGSFFAEWGEGGYIGAACGTRNEKAVEALTGILDEIKGMRGAPATPDELAVARDAVINAFVFHFQTPQQIIGERAELEFGGFPGDYLDTYVEHIRAVDRDSELAAAKKWLRPDESLILVVGPSSLAHALEAFGKVEVRKPD